MDRQYCSDVESRPGVLSGAPVVRGTRIPADAILANAEDGYSAEQIATELFEALPIEAVRKLPHAVYSVAKSRTRFEPRLVTG